VPDSVSSLTGSVTLEGSRVQARFPVFGGPRGASNLSPAKPSDLSHRVEAIGGNPLSGSDPAKLSECHSCQYVFLLKQ